MTEISCTFSFPIPENLPECDNLDGLDRTTNQVLENNLQKREHYYYVTGDITEDDAKKFALLIRYLKNWCQYDIRASGHTTRDIDGIPEGEPVIVLTLYFEAYEIGLMKLFNSLTKLYPNWTKNFGEISEDFKAV